MTMLTVLFFYLLAFFIVGGIIYGADKYFGKPN